MKFILSLVNRVLHLIRNPSGTKKKKKRKEQTFSCVPITGNADLWVNISQALQLFFFFFFFPMANKVNTKKQLISFEGRSICFNPS